MISSTEVFLKYHKKYVNIQQVHYDQATGISIFKKYVENIVASTLILKKYIKGKVTSMLILKKSY